MNSPAEKIAITVNTLLYIIQRIGGTGDFHKVFKMMYFADQKHLAKYGSAITEDKYIAMTYGPVPSMAYDILKSLRDDGLLATFREQFTPYFELVGKYTIKAKINPDLEFLSESEMQCLNESVNECEKLSFQQCTDRSHDSAWQNPDGDGEMDWLEIAKAGGAQNGMITYIKECIENKEALFG
jgi:uncharacterized phage-associated protein